MKTNSQSVSSDPGMIASFSYDECVERLAHAVDQREDAALAEVVYLISRLAVVIVAPT
jgi:hypothetical protein